MTQATPQPTSRERNRARLLLHLEAVLKDRAGDGLRYDPLCVILDAMGYKRTPSHPFGQVATRYLLLDALRDVHSAGRWHIRIDDISKDTPPVPHRGDARDPIRVEYRQSKEAR